MKWRIGGVTSGHIIKADHGILSHNTGGCGDRLRYLCGETIRPTPEKEERTNICEFQLWISGIKRK